jgi:O-antigen ligase
MLLEFIWNFNTDDSKKIMVALIAGSIFCMYLVFKNTKSKKNKGKENKRLGFFCLILMLFLTFCYFKSGSSDNESNYLQSQEA